MGICHAMVNALRGASFDGTRAEALRSLENTPLANRTSTSAIPDPVISPSSVEANYEVLESFRIELYYHNEVYDEEREREMEPRLVRVRETTPVLRTGSPHAQRIRGRVIEFEDALNKDWSQVKRVSNGRRPLERRAEKGGMLVSPTVSLRATLSILRAAIPSLEGSLSIIPMGDTPRRPFVDSSGCVTPFAYWIEDYPLPDGLKLPSRVGSYNGKGDPDNCLHLFEGAIRMCTDDTFQIPELHKEQCISGFVHGLNIRSLVEFLSTDLPTTYKGLMEKTYTWIKANEVATNGAQVITKKVSIGSVKVSIEITTKERRRIEIGSLLTKSRTMDLSPTYRRVEGKF
ncbi:hypothetical protein Tco_0162766 [Tanacetum coccineum]